MGVLKAVWVEQSTSFVDTFAAVARRIRVERGAPANHTPERPSLP